MECLSFFRTGRTISCVILLVFMCLLFRVGRAQIDEESESTHPAGGGVDENGVDQTVDSEPEPVKIDVGKVSSFEQCILYSLVIATWCYSCV